VNSLSRVSALVVVLAFVPICSANEKAIKPDLAKINDGNHWKVINAESNTSVEDGKRVVHLRAKGLTNARSAIGLA